MSKSIIGFALITTFMIAWFYVVAHFIVKFW